MAELEIGGRAMISHGSKKQAQLNGTMCILREYCPLDLGCGEPTWCVEFFGEKKRNDNGELYSWGWIQERYLIPLEPFSENENFEKEELILDV